MQNPEPETSQTPLNHDLLIEGRIIRTQLNRIEDQGRVIQVEPKVMSVLVCLAEQPGRVVTKEHLRQTVWGETHVTPHVLTRSISELRKIFHDDPKNPRVIETIPKTGYRLIAQTSKLPHEEETKPDSREAVSQVPQKPLGRLWSPQLTTLTRAAMIIMFLILGLFLFGRLMHQH